MRKNCAKRTENFLKKKLDLVSFNIIIYNILIMRGSLITKAKAFLLLTICGTALGKLSNAPYFYNKTRPLVVAHRGASG